MGQTVQLCIFSKFYFILNSIWRASDVGCIGCWMHRMLDLYAYIYLYGFIRWIYTDIYAIFNYNLSYYGPIALTIIILISPCSIIVNGYKGTKCTKNTQMLYYKEYIVFCSVD